MQVPCILCRQWQCVCAVGEVDAYYRTLHEKMKTDGIEKTRKLRESLVVNPDLQNLLPYQIQNIIEKEGL